MSEFFDKRSRLPLDIFEGYEEELRVTYIVECAFLFAWNRDDISSLPESTDDLVYEWSVMSRIPGDVRDIFGTIREKAEVYTWFIRSESETSENMFIFFHSVFL